MVHPTRPRHSFSCLSARTSSHIDGPVAYAAPCAWLASSRAAHCLELSCVPAPQMSLRVDVCLSNFRRLDGASPPNPACTGDPASTAFGLCTFASRGRRVSATRTSKSVQPQARINDDHCRNISDRHCCRSPVAPIMAELGPFRHNTRVYPSFRAKARECCILDALSCDPCW